ncbi:S8 family serine peptidase [Flavisolibacter sp. BT320]|nr:S8 family serine peptidase [Flavisolibacter longurius]
MREKTGKPGNSLPLFAILATIFCTAILFSASAQQLPIRDFVLFGANSTQIGTSTTVSGGRIGSKNLVQTTGNTTITAAINSDNVVQLANSNTVRGNITAANKKNFTGTIFSTGSNFSFPDASSQLHVGGNVAIQNGTIKGSLYMPKAAKYSGPKIERFDNPVFPQLPSLPAVTTFLPAGASDITGTGTAKPSTPYRDLKLSGGATVTFAGTGVYTFNSIKIGNAGNRLVLDFQDNTNGFIVIHVHGDVDLGKINVQLVRGGHASRVYMEVHGNGSTSSSGKEAWRLGNGASGTNATVWYGTVWAPNGDIFVGQGSTPPKVEGTLWSGSNVTIGSGVAVSYVQPQPCPPVVADAGADQTLVCPAPFVSIGTTKSSGALYTWTTVIDGKETIVGTTPIIKATRKGTYTLTVSNGCGNAVTDKVEVGYESCIEPINPNTGKTNNLIGHELTNLSANLEEAKKHLIILGENSDRVLIEAVAVVRKEEDAKAFLRANGLLNEIPNGVAYQIISGSFPINKLLAVNARPDLFNHCRPVFLPQGNAGIATSEGDRAIAANLARAGYNIGGAGVKVGVISDSYNRSSLQLDNAGLDVKNGDLPGSGNPEGNTAPVEVVLDYPYGVRSDEGRAMLQIIHDLAPKSPLAFRTGFRSAGDMAQGILELKEAGCKVIVDDVTYVTEPFFQDGVVAKAVDQVTNAGVSYFTSAGNFGQKAYTKTFQRAPAPANLGNYAHNFSGTGDIYQRLKLKSGTYTIVLQWKDAIYSLAQTQGTINDLDIYLVDQGERIGFNRNNLGGDPFEVLSFSINLPDTSQVIETDLLITKADNSADNPLLKYIIFRGNAVIDEYYSNQSLVDKSTIVGHANAQGAIAVGAVLFSNTAPFNNTPSIASFSSTGGTPVFVDGVRQVRRKPDVTAPNGVNTSSTVVMGPDIDFVNDPVNGSPDGFPNFYGTSASAPHAAAVAALIMEARKKFYDETLDPTGLRFHLYNSAAAMQPDGVVDGWNYKAGFGLVQPFGAIRNFANPTPRINELIYDPNITPGTTPFTVQVKGEYFTGNTVIYFRGKPVPTEVVDANTLQATINLLSAAKAAVNVYTSPLQGTNGTDGGLSNTLYLFSARKLKVVMKADSKEKKYGEAVPPNSMTILVENDSLHVFNQKFGEALTPESLGLQNVTFTYSEPSLNPLSNVGEYRIDVSRPFDPQVPTDAALLELYDYSAAIGTIKINKLAVTVSPQNRTVTYGDPLDDFTFNYVFDPAAKIADQQALTNAIRQAHEAHVDNSVLGVMNSTGGGAAVFFQNKLLPVYQNAAIIYQNKLYPIIVNAAGSAVIILNGAEYPVVNSTRLTGSAVVILNGEEYPVINGGGAIVILNGQILPVINRGIGGAVVILNGVEYPVVNSRLTGGAVVILNGEEVPVINGGGGAVIILNGQYLPVVNSRLTGGAVVILNGEEYPVVNSRLTGGAVVILNGEEIPVQNNLRTAVTILNGQLYDVVPNATGRTAVVILNGAKQGTTAPYLNGVGGSAVVILNGQILPVVNRSIGSAVVILNGKEYPVVNSTRLTGGAVVILNGEEIPLVNSISPATLTNMSMAATLNAIANARTIAAQPNKFIDVAANALVQFNTNSATSPMLNALAYVNARTLVDANRLANGERVIVNKGPTAVTILNGSTAYVNEFSLEKNTTVKAPVIYDQADLNSAVGNVSTIAMEGINMITGINSGEQYIIPAALYSPNFIITYGVGTVNILKAPLNLKANNVTKEMGIALNLNPANFSISQGSTKYGEKIAVANLASNGAGADAAVGSYPIQISNAIGSYGTDIANYQVGYTPGLLQVVSSCPVVTHSRNNSFVNTVTAPVSLWLNVQIKLRGQLTKEGDSIELRSGRLVLENIDYENSSAPIHVLRGVVIATRAVTEPVSHFDVKRNAFVTRVPLGFSSTADLFITGALVHSKKGFLKLKNSGSVLSGSFRSNVSFGTQWNYAIAAYSAPSVTDYVTYTQLAATGSIVGISSTSIKAGTPLPWKQRITAGGTGNGGTNYTGSPSNYDNVNTCIPPVMNTRSLLTARDTELAETAQLQSAGLQAYPNPAGSEFTLSFLPPATGQATMQVVSASGARVLEIYRGTVEANRLYIKKIDAQKWAAGVYIIQVVLHDRIINRKLVISPH